MFVSASAVYALNHPQTDTGIELKVKSLSKKNRKSNYRKSQILPAGNHPHGCIVRLTGEPVHSKATAWSQHAAAG